jgi:hypothetical protein
MLWIVWSLQGFAWRFESVQKLGPVTGQPNGQTTGAPFDMLLFGATGDLALRKLVPALYRRHLAGQIVAGSRVLAVARTSQSRETYLAQIEETCRKYLRPEEFSAERWKSFAAVVDYLTIDATQAQDFKKLSASLAGRDDVVRVIFLSTAPSLFTLTCDNLAAAGLVTPKSRVVLEKPLGHDRTSAEAINRSVGAMFAEHQIYRIDHYLGKEAVQNLIALRFGNTCADHGSRATGRRRAGAVLRSDRCVARHGAKSPVATRLHPRNGTAGEQRSGCRARREAESAARATADSRS